MSFTSDMQKAAEKIEDSVEEAGRRVVDALFSSIIKATPVDTGRLRGNWGVGVNTGNVGSRNRFGGAGPLGEVKNKVKGPAAYWLSNNLPYAMVAEFGGWGTGEDATVKTTRDGFSIQAPVGMARINVIRIARNIRRYAK